MSTLRYIYRDLETPGIERLDVYRAAGALICLGRWLHRVPT